MNELEQSHTEIASQSHSHIQQFLDTLSVENIPVVTLPVKSLPVKTLSTIVI